MNDYFSFPAGVTHSPVARRVKGTQFRQGKSWEGDNVLWFNQDWTNCCRQGKHNQEELVYWSLLKKRKKNHWPAEDSVGADPFKGFNGQWLQAIISESQTFVTVNNSQDGLTKCSINRTEGNCSEWGRFWKIKSFLIFYFSFYPTDVTALKHIIVWNCPCVWPELKSLLTTPDPEPCSRKTAEAKWEERQSSR